MNNSTTFDYTSGFEIAIIGMVVRFPEAKTIDRFWENLRDGVDARVSFTDEELLASGVDPALLSDPRYVKVSTVLDDLELFDASFFGFNPREAEIMDPQHRLFLEAAWEALEQAGYDIEQYKGLVGVYAGTGMNSYVLINLIPHHNLIETVGRFQTGIANDKDFLTTRVSYKLNLEGPSVTVQTACSTSLVAVHLACQGLLSGECDMALAGGVSIRIPQKSVYLYQEGGIVSPDGYCRAFDAKAQGTIFGSGLGIVVLKRLRDALADGDTIHAVIKGSAINNDGALKIGYTAPRVDGQAKVIRAAQLMAGVEPETISYIEAHGTGTKLGDPIEIAALTQVFRARTDKKGFCAVGSVKTNIGHLDVAAGVAGLIKTVLALKHKMIPPSLHFETPNPEIDFANSPFYVNAKLAEWKHNGMPRRAGVSSFGIGGTNAHVVVEEAPEVEQFDPSRLCQLLLLSAKTDTALEAATTNLAVYLKQHPEINLADVAHTLQIGRQAFDHRRMVVCQDLDEAIAALKARDPQSVLSDIQEIRERPVAFMFSGQGAQYVNMGLELYQTEPVFRQQVQHCAELLEPHLGLGLCQLLYPSPEDLREAEAYLAQTSITQPALFVIEYALAKLWQEWGVYPEAMIGHSIGEYVAACLAGVFSLEDALALVATRGRLMQSMSSGTMLAVPLSPEEILPLLGKQLSLAAHNGPSLCVVSGPTEAVETLQSRLAGQGLACRRLHTSHAFHSEMMAPILEPFTEQFKKVKLAPPQIPYISNVSGTWITASEATDPVYWARHIRQTVRFAEGIKVLLQDPNCVLLEVGPGETLVRLSRQQPDEAGNRVALSSLHHPTDQQSDVAFLLKTLGRLWLSGVSVSWPGFYARERRQRIPLPTYPFERQCYWVEPPQKAGGGGKPQASAEKKASTTDWFYTPTWCQSIPSATWKAEALWETEASWLVFIDQYGLGARIVQRLKEGGQAVTSVTMGKMFKRVGEGEYALNPCQPADYLSLFEELRHLGRLPHRIVHLWSVMPDNQVPPAIRTIEATQYLGFYSLLFLVQALDKQRVKDSLHIDVISDRMQAISGEAALCPEKATVLGLCRVIPQEYLNLTCRSIDVAAPKLPSWQAERLTDQLVVELITTPSDSVVAYRSNRRWVQVNKKIPVDGATKARTQLREGGIYLIIEGLKGTGFLFAESLARSARAKLILTEPSDFREREAWVIERVQELENLGAKVLVVQADITSQKQMTHVIDVAHEQFGGLHGVVITSEIAGEEVFCPVHELDPAECERLFERVVSGLWILDEILQDRKLDFCLVQSSLASVLGGLGLGLLSAASLLVDAFVNGHNQTHPVPWVSLNWDFQQQTENKIPSLLFGSSLAELAITPREAVEAFEHIFSLGAVTQIAVSTADLEVRLNQSMEHGLLRDTEGTKKADPSGRYPRPNLQNDYVAPRNAVEQIIADIWQTLLGIEQVGVYDNFFDLGGHSLLTTQVATRLRTIFQRELPLQDIFEIATISGLADKIGETLGGLEVAEEVALIFKEVSNLSEEEVTVMLVKEESNNGK